MEDLLVPLDDLGIGVFVGATGWEPIAVYERAEWVATAVGAVWIFLCE